MNWTIAYAHRTTKTPRKIEQRLTKDQLHELGARIIDRFYSLCAGGTCYGCDWPTMWALFPRMCRVFFRLKAEYKGRK